jgi:AhpD family alkylhydroperoxidase
MLDEKTKGLIAVGAAISANCQSCLEVLSDKAREQGATDAEILAAIEVGKQVRTGAADTMARFASKLMGVEAPGKVASRGCC